LPSFLTVEPSEIIEKTPDSSEEHVLKVSYEDFQKARLEIGSSAMREVWSMP